MSIDMNQQTNGEEGKRNRALFREVSATEITLTLSKHQPEDAFRGPIIAPSPETRRCLEQVRHMLTVREVTKKI